MTEYNRTKYTKEIVCIFRGSDHRLDGTVRSFETLYTKYPEEWEAFIRKIKGFLEKKGEGWIQGQLFPDFLEKSNSP